MNKSISNLNCGIYASFFETQKSGNIWRIEVKKNNKIKDHFLVREAAVDKTLKDQFHKWGGD